MINTMSTTISWRKLVLETNAGSKQRTVTCLTHLLHFLGDVYEYWWLWMNGSTKNQNKPPKRNYPGLTRLVTSVLWFETSRYFRWFTIAASLRDNRPTLDIIPCGTLSWKYYIAAQKLDDVSWLYLVVVAHLPYDYTGEKLLHDRFKGC